MVIVIVAILVAIALPSYNNQIKRSKRTAGQGQMMLIANKQAEYLLTSRAYLDDAAMEANGFSISAESAKNYDWDVTVVTGALPTYLVTFTPKGSMAGESTLTLDSSGNGTPADEWER